jgi:hypothetical protein
LGHILVYRMMDMRFVVLLLLGAGGLVSCTRTAPKSEIYLLQGSCDVKVKTNHKKSRIYLDGILIGHGEASSTVPCGEKHILVKAKGKKIVNEYHTAIKKIPLELSIELKDLQTPSNWAMSSALVEQLRKGLGPIDNNLPDHKEILASRVKQREQMGYSYSAEELVAMSRKALGAGDDADDSAAGIVIDPNTNFDDPNTWM